MDFIIKQILNEPDLDKAIAHARSMRGHVAVILKELHAIKRQRLRYSKKEHIMTATRKDIQEWIKRGKEDKKRWLIVVCDDFNHDNYAVFVDEGKDIKEKVKHFDGVNMQSVDEVYDLSKPIEPQLRLSRCRADRDGYK